MIGGAAWLLIGALLALLWLPTLSDILQLIAVALRPRRRAGPVGARPRLCFLVPAHDEALLIEHCVRALFAQRNPPGAGDVLVIADNCTDDTATRAQALGAIVHERADHRRRGKPFAIAWALERIDLTAFDAIVIVDADVEVDGGFADALAKHGPLRGKVVQPFNDVRNREDTPLTRMAALQATVLHGLVFRLKHRAGLGVPLSAGMCVGTDVIRTHGWPAFSVGEDFELYVILTLAGVRIEHCVDARLYAQEARTLRQGATQRQRWTAGKLHVIQLHLGDTVRANGVSIVQRIDLVAEMLVSGFGPVLHLSLVVGISGLLWLIDPPSVAMLQIVLLASLARLGLLTSIAVLRDDEPFRAIAAFATLPAYAVTRLRSTVAAFSATARSSWIRTDRHSR